MRLELVFAFVVAVVLGAAITLRLPRIWSGRHKPTAQMFWFWLPPSLARGAIRALPVDAVFVWVCAAFVVASGFGAEEPVVGEWTASKVLAFLAAALLVVIGSIILFNQPKALVAPYLRSQPGALAEWLSRSRPGGVQDGPPN